MQDRRRLKHATSFVAAFAEKSFAPFPSPLIEPDVTISVIRLSDGFHSEACAEPWRYVGSKREDAQFTERALRRELPAARPGDLVPAAKKVADCVVQMEVCTACRALDTQP